MLKKLYLFISLILFLIVNVNALVITDNTYLNNPINSNTTSQLITINTDVNSQCYITSNGIVNQSMTTSNNLVHTYNYVMGVPTLYNTTYNYSIDCVNSEPLSQTITDTTFLGLKTLNPAISCPSGICLDGSRLVSSNYPSGVYQDFNWICKGVLGANWNYQSLTNIYYSGQFLRANSDYSYSQWITNGNGNAMNTLTCSNPNGGVTTYNSSNSSLLRLGDISLNINVDTPFQNTNYTFDEFVFDLNLTTDKNSTCYYSFQNNETIFSNTNSTNHSTQVNLPIATTNIQNLIYDIKCVYENTNFNSILRVNKAKLPLSFDILVPINNQVFNAQTSNIEFNINTNYQSNCFYKLSNQNKFNSIFKYWWFIPSN